MRRIQNRVAESRWTLPMTILYSVVIWLLAGLIQEQWWIQFGCFLLASYLMANLNNTNVLIRIYSRMVSVSFIALSSTAVFLFPSVKGAFVQLCFIASLLLFYNCYQDKEAIIVYSICWRTFLASLVGLLTPYWFWTAWKLWLEEGNLTMITEHFSALADFRIPDPLTFHQTLLLILVAILGITGTIHFVRTSSRDKIRTRQLYYSFFILGMSAAIFLMLQPQHYDMLIRIMIIATSPFIGHFLALTKTKFTNMAFIVITIAILTLTVFYLWTSLSIS